MKSWRKKERKKERCIQRTRLPFLSSSCVPRVFPINSSSTSQPASDPPKFAHTSTTRPAFSACEIPSSSLGLFSLMVVLRCVFFDGVDADCDCDFDCDTRWETVGKMSSRETLMEVAMMEESPCMLLLGHRQTLPLVHKRNRAHVFNPSSPSTQRTPPTHFFPNSPSLFRSSTSFACPSMISVGCTALGEGGSGKRSDVPELGGVKTERGSLGRTFLR